MPGTYPATLTGAGYFPAFNIMGYSATLTASVVLLSNGAGQGYFTAYKACTIYEMSFCIVNSNGVASSITFQPYGSLSGGNGGNLGTSKVVSVPSSGPFVAYSQVESISLLVGGYAGILVSSSVSNAILQINATLWAYQTAA